MFVCFTFVSSVINLIYLRKLYILQRDKEKVDDDTVCATLADSR
jgi:hypothetical protein